MHKHIQYNPNDMNPLRRQILFLFLVIYGLFLPGQIPKREFRGAWIATVKNIDWPSEAGLYSGVQAGEYIDLLNTLQASGINAVIVQIRPAGDAFYDSPYEPWSEWLTGTQGKAPEPYWDPLQLMVSEAHKRGMEFHAWFNPYRVDMNWQGDKIRAPNHLSNTHPEWTLAYGANLYLDPGIPAAREYVTRIVLDVVRRYEIDAVHFDDYFYPYRIPEVAFPDTLSYDQYGQRFLNRDDWRRDNVNQFIEALHDSLFYLNPEIQFGISPFGVWRNEATDPTGSATRAGQTSYDDLYADIRLWLQKGWIDYVMPQAYFSIGYPPADFEELIRWWAANCAGKRLYIGHSPYKIANNADQNWNDPGEIPRQIRATREIGAIDGSAYFSARWFTLNPLSFADSLNQRYYRYPALLPQVQKGDAIPPLPPDIGFSRSQKRGIELNWQQPLYGDSAAYYVIYRSQGKVLPTVNPTNINHILGSDALYYRDEETRFLRRYHYLITAVDRQHNESAPSQLISKVRLSGLGKAFRDFFRKLGRP